MRWRPQAGCLTPAPTESPKPCFLIWIDLFYMTRAPTRTNFHSSRLIRVLADLAMMETTEPGTAFAEKLALWLDHNEAINLYGTLSASAANPPAATAGLRPGAGVAIGEAFTRVSAALESAIINMGAPVAGKARMELPAPTLEVPLVLATAYEPYRRYYLAHQRDMEASIRPLRAKVRDVLARAAPALKTLAGLDAALGGMLAERETKLLATVPKLLEKRFAHLFKAHQQLLLKNELPDNPAYWMHAGGWLARFRNDLQTVLLAELELRLQPTLGLMEALNHETSKQT